MKCPDLVLLRRLITTTKNGGVHHCDFARKIAGRLSALVPSGDVSCLYILDLSPINKSSQKTNPLICCPLFILISAAAASSSSLYTYELCCPVRTLYLFGGGIHSSPLRFRLTLYGCSRITRVLVPVHAILWAFQNTRGITTRSIVMMIVFYSIFPTTTTPHCVDPAIHDTLQQVYIYLQCPLCIS